MVEPVGAVLGDAPRVRRDRGTADQQGAAGYQPRRARRHPRADAAEPLRRRLGDEPRRDRRPAAYAARRWPRDDRDDARLGGRAASPPPNGPARARRGGGFGWQRAARGDDPRGATYPSGNRPCGTAGEGRQPPGGTVDPTEGVRRAGQHRADPRQRVAVPERADVRSTPLPRRTAGPVPVDPVRRRHPALPGRRVREHGDARRPAYHAARGHTGAASGIGRGLARRLSGLGSPVAIADVDGAGLKATEASLSGPVLRRVLDVRDAADQLQFAGEVRAWLPAPLGAVFNNAGVAVAATVLDAVPEDDDWLFETNFYGVVNGTRAFLPILVEQDDGVIVNTSSVYGLVGMPYQSAYCASKFAIRGFTDALLQELRGTGVRAVTVHPGGIKTNIVRNARIRTDPEGLGRSKEQLAAQFEAIAMTSADKAAAIIHHGGERRSEED